VPEIPEEAVMPFPRVLAALVAVAFALAFVPFAAGGQSAGSCLPGWKLVSAKKSPLDDHNGDGKICTKTVASGTSAEGPLYIDDKI
jgi:hypothetical protein